MYVCLKHTSHDQAGALCVLEGRNVGNGDTVSVSQVVFASQTSRKLKHIKQLHENCDFKMLLNQLHLKSN